EADGPDAMARSAIAEPRLDARQRSLAALLLSGPRFVDAQRASADVFAVELRNGRFGFALVRHLDETETARASRLSIHEDLDGRNLAKRTEGIAKLVFAHLVRQISNVDIHHSRLSRRCVPPMRRSTNGVRSSAAENSTAGAFLRSMPRYSRISFDSRGGSSARGVEPGDTRQANVELVADELRVVVDVDFA